MKKITEAVWIEGDDLIVNTTELAHIFGVCLQATSQWGKAGCPKLGRGKWNLREVITWRSGNFVTSEDVDADNLKERQLLALTLYREEKAKKEKLQREALEGKFLPYEDVENAWASRVVELKSGLMNWCKSLPPQLAEEDESVIEERLDIEVRDLLEQYYRKGKYTPKQTT